MKNLVRRLTSCLSILFALLFIPFMCEADEVNFDEQMRVSDEHCGNDFDASQEKVYIQPESITILHNQIYVQIEKDLIPIGRLFCDDKGIFVLIDDIRVAKGIFGDTWICPKCGYENYVVIQNCGQCGRYRHAKDGW